MSEADFQQVVQEVAYFGQRLQRLERAMLLFWGDEEHSEDELTDLLAQMQAEHESRTMDHGQ